MRWFTGFERFLGRTVWVAIISFAVGVPLVEKTTSINPLSDIAESGAFFGYILLVAVSVAAVTLLIDALSGRRT